VPVDFDADTPYYQEIEDHARRAAGAAIATVDLALSWMILGHTIDGTQAEYIRIPYADTSLYHLPSQEPELPLTVSVAPNLQATAKRLSSRSIKMIRAGE
jgi:threonine dehydrogenase-like Zn-dependent dehydrogenase